MINKAADMVLLSVLWCVFSLPILTIGASSAALYHVIVKAIREDTGSTYASFVKAFKGNLRQTIPVTALSLLAMAAFGGTIFFLRDYTGSMITGVYSVFSFFCLLVTVLIQIHAYPLIGRFHLNKKEFISVLVKLTGQGLFKNLLSLLLFACAAAASIFYPPLLFFTPAGYTLLLSYIEEPRYRKYINYKSN